MPRTSTPSFREIYGIVDAPNGPIRFSNSWAIVLASEGSSAPATTKTENSELRQRTTGACILLSVILLAFFCISGCGPNRPKTVRVTGRVTINGNAPGEVGQLYFTPKKTAEGYASRPASGAFTPDGAYRVMSWTPDDGLVPGDYSVSVSPADPNKTAIPKRYQLNTSSGLEVNVPVDQKKVDFNIDMHTK